MSNHDQSKEYDDRIANLSSACFYLSRAEIGMEVIQHDDDTESFPRPPSKRVVAVALIDAFSQLGNVAES